MAAKGTVKIKVNKEFFGDVRSHISQGIRASSEVLSSEQIKLIESDKSGRFYPLPGTGRWGTEKYQASAPGEPAASPTSAYLNSIGWKISADNSKKTESLVGSTLGIASTLERGTQYMRKRPLMRPSLKQAEPMMQAAFMREKMD